MYKVNKSRPSPKVMISASNRTFSKLFVNKYMNRECILFPTYAYRNPQDLDEWVIRTKGWALTFKKPGPKQKVLKGITKSIAGKSTNDNEISNRMFENRFKYFLAKGKRNKEFNIEAVSATSPTEYQYQNINSHNPSSWIQTASCDTIPIIPTSSTDYHPSYIFETKGDPANSLLPAKLNLFPSGRTFYDTVTSDVIGSSNTESRPVQNSGVVLKSKGAGMILGELRISDQQVQALTCQGYKRMIKIRSKSRRNPKKTRNLYFPPSFGEVQMIEPYGVSVISDIDDTIKDTKVLSGARTVLKNTFFNPTRAIPGMADTYLDWYNCGASFHYVSNSPFQLVHMLCRFIGNHKFPPGSFHLRPNMGLVSKFVETAGRSKEDSINQIIRDFPNRKFVLVGDSAEIDLEIYTRIAAEFPNQILKIFIRDLTSNDPKGNTKKSYLTSGRKFASSPSFFASNLTRERLEYGFKSASYSNLDTRAKKQEQSDFDEDDEEDEDDDEGINGAASKLAEMVLEPSLTGHDPLLSLTSETPVSPTVTQLHNRICQAKRLLKGIDIVVFKESKELQQDKKIRQALNSYT